MRSGRPKTARSQEKVNKCKELVESNRRVSIYTLSRTLSISYGSVHAILHKDLALRKKSAILVPHALTAADRRNRLEFCTNFVSVYGSFPEGINWLLTTDESWFYALDPYCKRENMQWLPTNMNCPQVVARDRNARKLMFVPFFDTKGLVHGEFFINETVTKEVFQALLTRVRESIKTKRGSRVWNQRHRYRLHMDNAPAHRSYLVHGALLHWDWPVLKHPAYSPDLSPCDFFLFPLLKKKMRGKDFRTIDNLKEAILDEVGQITAAQWHGCFVDWVRRCRRCLQFNGGYFEGMKFLPQN